MKNTKRTALALLIAATAMPLTIAMPALAGPDESASAVATEKPTMDAKAKKIWERAIEAGMTKNADEEWIKSVRMVGTMSMPSQGITADMNVLMVPESGMRLTMTIPGMGSFNQGVLGDVVWSSDMMSGPKILEDEESEALLKEMDLFADVHWDEYYQSITYTGEESIEMPDGTAVKTQVLELTAIDTGDVSTRYYDIETGHTIKVMAIAEIPGGGKVPTTTYNTDFREVNGVTMAFKNTVSTGPMQQIIEFSEIEINGEYEESDLALPEDVAELLED
jgi:hypothetical protein